jgi:hypothetical protein
MTEEDWEKQVPYTPRPTSTDRNMKIEYDSPSPESILDAVWSALDAHKWKTIGALRTVSDADDKLLIRLVDFLKRWEFVETRVAFGYEPGIRRRAGAIPPLASLQLLRAAATSKPQATSTRRRLAERVMCKRCRNKSFLHVSRNEVECAQCHEKQWFTIDHRVINSQEIVQGKSWLR